MPFFKGKGYGENGTLMESTIEAASRAEAREFFKEAFDGGMVSLTGPVSAPADAPMTIDEIEQQEVDVINNTDSVSGAGGDDTPPAAA